LFFRHPQLFILNASSPRVCNISTASSPSLTHTHTHRRSSHTPMHFVLSALSTFTLRSLVDCFHLTLLWPSLSFPLAAAHPLSLFAFGSRKSRTTHTHTCRLAPPPPLTHTNTKHFSLSFAPQRMLCIL